MTGRTVTAASRGSADADDDRFFDWGTHPLER
jgi:hypothetical protein